MKLTPPPAAILNSIFFNVPDISQSTEGSIQGNLTSDTANLRSAVINAATRARNAVREAMERREQQILFQHSLNNITAMA